MNSCLYFAQEYAGGKSSLHAGNACIILLS